MKVEEFIKSLKEIMDSEENFDLETKLKDIEDWDSLSFVAFLSFCNSKLKLSLTPDEVKTAVTVGDLFKLAGGNNAD